MLDDYIKLLKVGCLVVGLLVSVTLSVKVWRVLDTLEKSTGALNESLRKGSQVLDRYQEVALNEKNVKAIEAGLATAASFQATARLINVKVIPEVLREVREVGRQAFRVLETGEREISTQSREMSRTQEKVREGVEGLVEVEKELVDSIDETNESINSSLGEVKPLLIKGQLALDQAQVSLQNISGITANLESASERAPKIMGDIEKVTHKAPLIQKIGVVGSLVLGILGVVR